MAKSDKKKKKALHVTYNKKVFIAPDSINSMSAIHTKLYKDGTAIARLSDCNGSIRWHNNMNDQAEVQEMLTKLTNSIDVLTEFRDHLIIKSKYHPQN